MRIRHRWAKRRPSRWSRLQTLCLSKTLLIALHNLYYDMSTVLLGA